MSFEDLTFSWNIGIGYSSASHNGTVKVSDYFTEEEWGDMSEKDISEWLDEYLETEISNHLEANIWINDWGEVRWKLKIL